jgi:hypothetical protein
LWSLKVGFRQALKIRRETLQYHKKVLTSKTDAGVMLALAEHGRVFAVEGLQGGDDRRGWSSIWPRIAPGVLSQNWIDRHHYFC